MTEDDDEFRQTAQHQVTGANQAETWILITQARQQLANIYSSNM